MNFSWIRNLLLAFALGLVGVSLTSCSEDRQTITAQAHTTYTITVDRDLSLEQMIIAGHYGWINDDITLKNFPLKGKGKEQLVVELVTIDRSMSSEEVITEISRRGLRSATLVEQIAFSAAYPEKQRERAIVALGSVVRVGGLQSVPYLSEFGGERTLNLHGWVHDWFGWRFLAVRPFAQAGK